MIKVSRNRTLNSGHTQAGLTLMELLVALALGGFLVLGVVNVFLSTRESSSLEAALARVQDSGRFAMDILADDLRRTHYTGCNSVNRQPDILMKDFNYVGVRGYMWDGSNWDRPLDANDPSLVYISDDAVEGSIRADTDVLNMHVGTHVGTDLLQSDIAASDNSFTISGNPDCQLKDGDAVVISSCLTAHIFWADVTACDSANPDAVATVSINATKNIDGEELDGGYTTTVPTQLLKFETISWYVGDTGRDRNGINVYALYRQSMDDPPVEMVEGVEFMQVLYGQRIDNGPGTPTTRYVRADDPELNGSWDEVVSVRIGLLVQNYNPVRDDDDSRVYVLADPNSPITPAEHGGDLVLRQAFRVTTALRNTPYDL